MSAIDDLRKALELLDDIPVPYISLSVMHLRDVERYYLTQVGQSESFQLVKMKYEIYTLQNALYNTQQQIKHYQNTESQIVRLYDIITQREMSILELKQRIKRAEDQAQLFKSQMRYFQLALEFEYQQRGDEVQKVHTQYQKEIAKIQQQIKQNLAEKDTQLEDQRHQHNEVKTYLLYQMDLLITKNEEERVKSAATTADFFAQIQKLEREIAEEKVQISFLQNAKINLTGQNHNLYEQITNLCKKQQREPTPMKINEPAEITRLKMIVADKTDVIEKQFERLTAYDTQLNIQKQFSNNLIRQRTELERLVHQQELKMDEYRRELEELNHKQLINGEGDARKVIKSLIEEVKTLRALSPVRDTRPDKYEQEAEKTPDAVQIPMEVTNSTLEMNEQHSPQVAKILKQNNMLQSRIIALKTQLQEVELVKKAKRAAVRGPMQLAK